VPFDELEQRPKAPWLIDGLVRQQSVTFLYGKPDTFKTFLALDLCGAVMTGQPWLGADTRKSGAVLYIAAEGAETLIERLNAWSVQHDRAVPADSFFTIESAPQLSEGVYMDVLCAALDSRGYALVVIDTFGKSLGVLDENSNSEVNRALVAIGRIKDLGIAVVLVHHTGHTAADRLRGASAMYGGVDTVIRADLAKSDLLVKLSCDRQRRGQKFATFYAQLVEQQIGTDEWGQPETSLAVLGRGEPVAGAVSEREARRDSVLDYLRLQPDGQAHESAILRALDWHPSGSARRALFDGLAADGLIEKVGMAGRSIIWQIAT
jgi:hypothetical protein